VRGPSWRVAVLVGVGAGDVLGQVLAQVADRPVRPGRASEQALQVVLVPEPQHVGRLGIGVEGVERLCPGRQDSAGLGVDVAADLRTPAGRHDRVDGRVVRRPPHLVVGSRPDLAHDPPRDRASHRRVQVWGQATLSLDGGEVLDLIAGAATEVLPEPVDQLREVQRIERRPPVVVPFGIDGHALGRDPPV